MVRSQTSKLLAMDDVVEELSATAIKDIWVRQKLFKRKRDVLRQRYRNKPTGMYDTDEFERIKSQLTVGDEDGNYHQYIRTDTDFEIRKAAFEEGDTPSMNLWEYFTKDDMDEEDKVDAARRKLKTALEGWGMPHIEIIRDSVRAWAETEEVGRHE